MSLCEQRQIVYDLAKEMNYGGLMKAAKVASVDGIVDFVMQSKRRDKIIRKYFSRFDNRDEIIWSILEWEHNPRAMERVLKLHARLLERGEGVYCINSDNLINLTRSYQEVVDLTLEGLCEVTSGMKASNLEQVYKYSTNRLGGAKEDLEKVLRGNFNDLKQKMGIRKVKKKEAKDHSTLYGSLAAGAIALLPIGAGAFRGYNNAQGVEFAPDLDWEMRMSPLIVSGVIGGLFGGLFGLIITEPTQKEDIPKAALMGLGGASFGALTLSTLTGALALAGYGVGYLAGKII